MLLHRPKTLHVVCWVGQRPTAFSSAIRCSFKERGGRNALKVLRAAGTRGVVAASAGNHALALAYHGANLGIPVTVVMPVTASIMKVERCRHYKAEVIIFGQTIAEVGAGCS